MYVNKCTKCGREFETKNPKRVICPDCLYPDKKMAVSSTSDDDLNAKPNTYSSGYSSESQAPKAPGSEETPRYYSAGGNDNRYSRPQRPYNNQNTNYNRSSQGGGYNRDNRGGYNRDNRGGYNRDNRSGQNYNGGYNRDNRSGGYNRDNRGGYNQNRPQQGGYNRDSRSGSFQNRGPRPGGFNRDNRGNFQNRRPQQGGFNRSKGPKQLLISREQLEQIELLYKAMLPLPNPDAHEVIGEKIGLEPRKVFFGINLVRQKLMLPKQPFPKRKLAISPDQLFAIKNLYEPLLPLPPIGCHKIIAAQLKMDEWRVHVGIGLIRSQMGLQRWNQERDDAPEEFKKTAGEVKVGASATEVSEGCEVPVEKPKRGRKPKKAEDTPQA